MHEATIQVVKIAMFVISDVPQLLTGTIMVLR